MPPKRCVNTCTKGVHRPRRVATSWPNGVHHPRCLLSWVAAFAAMTGRGLQSRHVPHLATPQVTCEFEGHVRVRGTSSGDTLLICLRMNFLRAEKVSMSGDTITIAPQSRHVPLLPSWPRRIHHAITASPFALTIASSFNDGPLGRLVPRSQSLTSLVPTLR